MDRLDALNDADRDQTSPDQRPRDAATILIVDTASPTPRILMGRRNAKQVFMPGKFVFPGGRVDAADGRITPIGELDPRDETRLLHDMKGRPSANRAKAMALAAIRETFEETGVVIGEPVEASADAIPTAGAPSPSWESYFQTGMQPDLSELVLMARAITPPKRPRRYDTRFFITLYDRSENPRGPGDGELSDLQWFTVDEAFTLDIPPITRAVIEDFNDRLTTGDPMDRSLPIPYYFQEHGTFVRRQIA